MTALPPEHCGPWMQTFSGRVVDLLNPIPATLCIEDIAHHLSLICRYTGATPHHYSVAQHCIYVSRMVPREFARAGLLHDAAEAYLSDVSRPLKIAMREFAGMMKCDSPYDLLTDRFEEAIVVHFGLGDSMNAPEIKRADLIVLATEARDLGFLSKETQPWNLPLPPADFLLYPMNADQAYGAFLDECDWLGIT